MKKLILQPTGDISAKKHYDETINAPVTINYIERFLTEEELVNLKEIYPNGNLYIWGVTPGKNGVNQKKWAKISVGDITLFSAQKKIFASAVTTYKVHNKELAEFLWGYNSKNETWEYIYFVDEIKKQDIPILTFNNIIGYNSNYIIQGFNVLDPEKCKSTIDLLDLDSKIYVEEISLNEYVHDIEERFEIAEPTGKSLTSSRKEQSYLRKYLFYGKRTSKCGICGNEFPVEFLVTAHLKKRSLCTKEEMLDYKNIVMPICKFGCDDLYEKGFIYLEEGIIKLNPKKYFTEYMKKFTEQFINKKSPYWSQEKEKYFIFHKENFL